MATVLPQAAADAGCDITTAAAASGAWPADGYWYCNGEYSQSSITAEFAGVWTSCEVVITSRNHGTQHMKRGGGQEGYIDQPFDYTDTFTYSLYKDTSETYAPPAITSDDSPPQAFPFPARFVASGAYSWAWGGESAESALIKTDGEVEIVSIVATFYKSIPEGPILCNRAGEMICNSAGELLYHEAT